MDNGDEPKKETARERLARTRLPQASPDELLVQHDIKPPKHWDTMSSHEKLDFVGTRILANARGWTRDEGGAKVTSHSQMKEEGYFSESQYERRLEREIYSNHAAGMELKTTPGVFGRKFAKTKHQKERDNTRNEE